MEQALILGTGGASKAVVFALKKLELNVCVSLGFPMNNNGIITNLMTLF